MPVCPGRWLKQASVGTAACAAVMLTAQQLDDVTAGLTATGTAFASASGWAGGAPSTDKSVTIVSITDVRATVDQSGASISSTSLSASTAMSGATP